MSLLTKKKRIEWENRNRDGYSLCCNCVPSPLCSGEFVAQFKFTVLLMANGPLRITNSLFEPELYKSEHEVEDAELKVKFIFFKDRTWHPPPMRDQTNGTAISRLLADLAFSKPLWVWCIERLIGLWSHFCLLSHPLNKGSASKLSQP